MSHPKNHAILTISDMHHPFSHQDTVPFLAALKKKYQPDRVVCLGDEADSQALKFHPIDPDLPSVGDELSLAIAGLSPIYKLFPRVDVLESNHTSLAYRRAYAAGISRRYLKSYREILQAPAGWIWHHDLNINVGNRKIYFHHGLKKDGLAVAKQRGICVVQGHFHESFGIEYAGNPDNLIWAVNAGCLINSKSLAFNYNLNNLGRPVIGTAIILKGLPKLLPMLLDRNGRWTKEIP
jgi:predicted phosphodiesterase